MRKYIVKCMGWDIEVGANNIKQARHKAYMKFREGYPVEYINFMKNIESVTQKEDE